MDCLLFHTIFVSSIHSYFDTSFSGIHLGTKTGVVTGPTRHRKYLSRQNCFREHRLIIIISVKLGVVWAVRTIYSVHTS